MKKLFITLFTTSILISTLMSSSVSYAGGNFFVNVGLGYGGYGYGHNRYHGYGNRYGYSNRHIKFNHRGRYYGGYRNHSRYSGNLTTALILGGLVGYGISNLYERRHYHSRHTYYSHRYPGYSHRYPGTSTTYNTRIVKRKNAVVEMPLAGRRLHKDRNGDCFEIKTAANGDELRIELDRTQCDW